MSKTAIILSGGGITAAYCAGALLELHKQGIQPDIIIAGSGSTGTASYFVAKQYSDISKIWFEYLSNVRFLNFFRKYNKMDISYLVDEVFKKLVPLNETHVRESEIQYHIAVTHKETGIVTYFSDKDTSASIFTYMKASMCLPLLFNDIVMIDGEQYIDGLFSASADFHIEKARELGATKIYLVDSGVRVNRTFFMWYVKLVRSLFTRTQQLYLRKKHNRSYEGVIAIRRKKTSMLSIIYNSPQRIQNLFEEGRRAVVRVLPIQKRVLIINNHTVHLKELCDLFNESDVVNLEDFTKDYDVLGYDGVVISGATKGMPSLYRHPDFYKEQVEFVKNTTIPIVGICMGCQIVAHACGGELYQMPNMIKGKHAITYQGKTFKIYESHKMAVKSVPEDQFNVLATSHECLEIIKHTSKPILGIQFHPEVEPQEVFKKLIEENLQNKTGI